MQRGTRKGSQLPTPRRRAARHRGKTGEACPGAGRYELPLFQAAKVLTEMGIEPTISS